MTAAERQERALAELVAHRGLTVRELAQLTGMTPDQARGALRALMRRRLVWVETVYSLTVRGERGRGDRV